MLEEECPICFQHTVNKCLPCNHTSCETCLQRWFRQKKIRCPSCKQVIGCPVNVDVPISNNDFVFELSNNENVGISYKYSHGSIKVVNVARHEKAFSTGIRRGMIITHVNTIPVFAVKDVTHIIDAVKSYRGKLVVTTKEKIDVFSFVFHKVKSLLF